MGVLGIWWGLCAGLITVAAAVLWRFWRVSAGTLHPRGGSVDLRALLKPRGLPGAGYQQVHNNLRHIDHREYRRPEWRGA